MSHYNGTQKLTSLFSHIINTTHIFLNYLVVILLAGGLFTHVISIELVYFNTPFINKIVMILQFGWLFGYNYFDHSIFVLLSFPCSQQYKWI